MLKFSRSLRLALSSKLYTDPNVKCLPCFFFFASPSGSIPPPGIRPTAPSVKSGVLTNGLSEWKSLSCNQLCDPMDCSPIRLLCPRNPPGKNTGVGCHFPFQGIFPAQGLNWHLVCLLHRQAGSLPPSHLGSPRHSLPAVLLQTPPWFLSAQNTLL